MSDKTYNGWTNYETWVVNLWLNNDQGTQTYWHERAIWVAEEIMSNAVDCGDDLDSGRVRNAAQYDLTVELKDSLEEGAPELDGLYSDLLASAMQEVNWREIARHLLDDVWGEVKASVVAEMKEEQE